MVVYPRLSVSQKFNRRPVWGLIVLKILGLILILLLPVFVRSMYQRWWSNDIKTALNSQSNQNNSNISYASDKITWNQALAAVKKIPGKFIATQTSSEGPVYLVYTAEPVDIGGTVINASGAILGRVIKSDETLELKGYSNLVAGLNYLDSRWPINILIPDANEKIKPVAFTTTGDGRKIKVTFVSKNLTSTVDANYPDLSLKTGLNILSRSTIDYSWNGLILGQVGEIDNRQELLAPQISVIPAADWTQIGSELIYILPARL